MPILISPPSVPSEIFKNLFLGTIWSAKSMKQSAIDFGLVLNCTDEEIGTIRGVKILQLGLRDGHAIPPAKINYAVGVLQEYLRLSRGRPALVCCHASVSRSPAIVLSYLLGCGMGLSEAFTLLERRHPKTLIHPELLRSVKYHFGYMPCGVQD